MKFAIIRALALLGLFGWLLLLGHEAYAHAIGAKVTEVMSASERQKFSYVTGDVAKGLKEEEIKFYDAGVFSVIRIENPEYCVGDRCLTFVVVTCEKTFCPYSGAFVGPEFLIPDYISPRFGESVQVTFDCAENRSCAGFVVSRWFVSAIWLDRP